MSLTSVLETSEMRAFLKGRIHNPGLKPRPATVVASRTRAAPIIGTALDYALRFGMAVRGWGEIDNLVAIKAVGATLLHLPLDGHFPRARAHLDAAFEALAKFDDRAALSEASARACLLLAGLDPLYRAARPEGLFRTITDADIEELQALYRLIPWSRFTPTTQIALNPTFNEGSNAVSGADADILLDDCLIDIKTIKVQKLSMRDVRQVVSYALLANRFGVHNIDAMMPVRRLGIYFSRAGVLHTFALSDCIDSEQEEPVLDQLFAAWQQQDRSRM